MTEQQLLEALSWDIMLWQRHSCPFSVVLVILRSAVPGPIIAAYLTAASFPARSILRRSSAQQYVTAGRTAGEPTYKDLHMSGNV